MSINVRPKILFPVVDQDIVERQDYHAWDELVFQSVKH
jgi:hypothetical protein